MAKLLLTINQKERELIPDNTTIGFVASGENVAHLIFSDNYFDGYSIGIVCAIEKNCVINLEYNADKNEIALPYSMFTKSGYKYLSICALKGTETITSNLCELYVAESNDFTNAINIPKEPGWLDIAKDLFENILKNEYDQSLQTLISEAAKQQSKAVELQQEANKQQTEASRQQDIVNVFIEQEEQYLKNEEKRINAEEIRIEAENNRISAENERQINTSQAIIDSQQATLNANGAAEEARNAIRDFSDTPITFKEANILENINDGEQLNILFGKIKKYFNYLVPTGSISSYAGDMAPTGYLLCQGQIIRREEYKELFNVIGTRYGDGDGVTTFCVPDLRSRMPVGEDSRDIDFNTLGKSGGSKKVALTLAQLPPHNHVSTTSIASTGAHIHSASSANSGTHGHNANIVNASAHTHSLSATAASAGSHAHSFEKTNLVAYGNGTGGSINLTLGPTGFHAVSDTLISGAHTHSINGTATSAGAHNHTITIATNGEHSHTLTVNSGGNHSHSAITSIENSGGGEPYNNMQPYMVLNYIIKY